jgi:hypothetical protein
MWSIIDQIEKSRKGKVTIERVVKCKHLKCFPVLDGGDVVGFGRFKFLQLKVIIQHKIEQKPHIITYNNRGGFNTFIYHYPTKEQGSTSFTNIANLNKFLQVRGEEFAKQVCESFAERIGQHKQAVVTYQENKAKKEQAKKDKQMAKMAKLAEKERKKQEREAKRLAKGPSGLVI